MTAITAEDEIYRRWKLFQESGNRDYLVDVAKFAMWSYIKRGERAA